MIIKFAGFIGLKRHNIATGLMSFLE